MSSNFTQRALSVRDELASELKIRLSALAQAKSFGAGGECDLLVGAGTAGSDTVFVRITAIPTVQKDVLGLAQQVFANHVAQIVIEANYAGATDNVADVGTWATRLAIIGALVARGIKVELYVSANTVVPSSAGITGIPAATFEIATQYPMMASM